MRLIFFFNDTATTEIYTLSLHDALPISLQAAESQVAVQLRGGIEHRQRALAAQLDRKSTRLNSSHLVISYAVFCLKKKNRVAHFRTEADATALSELVIPRSHTCTHGPRC